jgi:hypothetical protein
VDAGQRGGDAALGRADLVSLAIEFGVGDWDVGGSEFTDDGDIEVDVGIGGEEVGWRGFVR